MKAARQVACCMALLCAAIAPPALAQEISAASYADPTTRYTHGVLGDAVEWGALRLDLSDGRRVRITLPDSLVFEDTTPRLADLDGDGGPEVIVVEAALDHGARLVIYDETGRIAATPHIGRANRWLAPVGAADLDGDGAVEIAYIDRPHLAKTLRIWRYQDRRLVHVADAPGLTNHRIGWEFIPGGVRDCGSGPEIVTADADWSRIVATRLVAGRLTSTALRAYDGPESLNAALSCR